MIKNKEMKDEKEKKKKRKHKIVSKKMYFLFVSFFMFFFLCVFIFFSNFFLAVRDVKKRSKNPTKFFFFDRNSHYENLCQEEKPYTFELIGNNWKKK